MADRLSWDELYPFMDEVKALARGLLRHERQASLQTTALMLSALRRQRPAESPGPGARAGGGAPRRAGRAQVGAAPVGGSDCASVLRRADSGRNRAYDGGYVITG